MGITMQKEGDDLFNWPLHSMVRPTCHHAIIAHVGPRCNCSKFEQRRPVATGESRASHDAVRLGRRRYSVWPHRFKSDREVSVSYPLRYPLLPQSSPRTMIQSGLWYLTRMLVACALSCQVQRPVENESRAY